MVGSSTESWALPRKHAHLHRDIVRRYESVGARPYKLDVVSISIEIADRDMDGAVPAQAARSVEDKKTFDLAGAQWQRFTEAAGRFTGLLSNSKLVDPTKQAD